MENIFKSTPKWIECVVSSADCSQIVEVLYDSKTSQTKKIRVKVPITEDIPAFNVEVKLDQTATIQVKHNLFLFD